MKSHIEFEEIAKTWSNRLQHKKVNPPAITTADHIVTASFQKRNWFGYLMQEVKRIQNDVLNCRSNDVGV